MLKILFKAEEKKFISATGAKKFTPDRVEGDGWKCTVTYNGCIRCKCTEIKNSKYFETLLHINERGWLTFSQIKEGVNYQRRRYKIRNWPIDGQLVFYGGEFEERNAVFYEVQKVTENWKKEQGISEIKLDDPNGIRFLEFYNFEEKRQFSIEHIETDGKVKFISEDSGATLAWQEMYPGTNSFENYEKLEITDATWTIITKVSTKECSRILYTLKNPMLLRNLPEGPKNIPKEEK